MSLSGPDLDAAVDAALPFGAIVRDGAVAGCWWSVPKSRDTVPRVPGVPTFVEYDPDPVPRPGHEPSLRACGLWRTPGGAPSAARSYRVAAPSLRALFEGLASDLDPHPGTDEAFGDVLRDAVEMVEGGKAREAGLRQVAEALAAGMVHAEVVDAAASRRAAAVGAFLGTLDPAARGLVDRIDTLDLWEADAYRMLDRTFTPDAPLAAAMAAFPDFPYLCAGACREDPDAFAAAVRGSRLDRFLMGASGLPRHLARLLPAVAAALGGYDPIRVAVMTDGIVGQDFAVTLAAYMEGLPPSWAPRDEASWHVAMDCVPVLSWARCLPGDAYRTVIDVRGDWVGFRDRLAAEVTFPHREADDAAATGAPATLPEALATALEGVGDAARALSRQVVAPGVALARGLPHGTTLRGLIPSGRGDGDDEPCDPDEEAHAGLLLMACRRPLAATLRASASWHRRRQRIDDAILSLPGEVAAATSWPAAFPDHAERDGKGRDWRLTVLTNVAALVDEGSPGKDAAGDPGLDHCVAGYADDCRSGRCRIASVRRLAEGRWHRAYTVEIVLDGDGMPYVRQVGGYRNGRPGLGAAGFVTGYLAKVRLSSMAARSHARMLEDMAPLPSAGTVSGRAGYEWWRPGHWEAARDAWVDLLPRGVRAMTAAEVAALCTDDDGGLSVPYRVDPEDLFPPAPAG